MGQANLNDQPQDFFSWLAGWIEKETGIVYSLTNLYQLESRLENLVKLKLVTSQEELKQRLLRNDSVLSVAVKEMATNHETLFFRDTRFFSAIETELIPKWKARGEPVRIWSAASSSGQEIYSVSMLLERSGLRLHVPKIEMLATDMSNDVVQKAKSGIYSAYETSRGLTDEEKQRHFKKVEGTMNYSVNPELSQGIDFRVLNLMKDIPPFGNFDLILCRNVLIYFSVESRRQVLATFERAMKPGGFLALGAGETLMGIDPKWKTQLLTGLPFFTL